jgi:hypothetical protein
MALIGVAVIAGCVTAGVALSRDKAPPHATAHSIPELTSTSTIAHQFHELVASIFNRDCQLSRRFGIDYLLQQDVRTNADYEQHCPYSSGTYALWALCYSTDRSSLGGCRMRMTVLGIRPMEIPAS